MQYLIIGTAGHIDHGKTTLVKALTGVDTDRLIEEKRRKITIDLGFAQLSLSDQMQAGIIDLPGHIDYIKNMMVGASGVDLALMTVAADEGIMPQTLEHLEILSQFGVQHGVIALTKCDLVEKDTLNQVRIAVKNAFSKSFLQDAPMIEVSAVCGQGMQELQKALAEQATQLLPHESGHPFWMPVDRVFTVAGFGTVATGTVLDGILRTGDMVRLLPSGVAARVRGLQSGGISLPAVFAGQRAAVNLAGVKSDQLCRGGTLTVSSSANVYTHLDVKLAASPNAPRPLTHGMQMHLAIGTDSQVCRLCLLDAEKIMPGESAFAQLRLQKPMAARQTDRFVLHYFSPMELAGGGMILALDPPKHRKLDKQVLERLHLYERGTLAQKILLETSLHPQTRKQLYAQFWHLSEDTVQKACESLVQQGALQQGEGWYLQTYQFQKLQKNLLEELADWQTNEPFSEGMPQHLLKKYYPDFLLHIMEKQGNILCKDAKIILSGKNSVENPLYLQSKRTLAAYCKPLGFYSITEDQVFDALKLPKKQAEQALERLLQEGFLVQLPNQTYLLRSVCQQAWEQTAQELSQQGKITLARLRDLLKISRKHAQPILEWFDLMGLTCRIDDYRVLNN